MRTIAIVQARTNSSRYPLKIFASLNKRPMLAHVLERAAAIQGIDQVVLAVPENDVRLVSHLWPHVYGGSERDVLSRYAGAAEKYEADIVLRVTGDCPLFAPDIASDALRVFSYINSDEDEKGDYMAVCKPYSPVADGWDVEIFSRRTLVNAQRYAEKSEREHVTTWMRKLDVLSFNDWDTLPDAKYSVDTREDLQRVKKIMDCLEDKTDFSYKATWAAWERAGRP